jgi:hypothetical protein
MYAGFITSKYSANWLGAHQKFDRIAYRLIMQKVAPADFPFLENILKFEGYNGPDGLKVKSAGQFEPSHFYDPLSRYGSVIGYIKSHYETLTYVLQQKDTVRAGFEASWLAHAITDGLTPAHHVEYESEINKLRQESLRPDITKPRHKIILKAPTKVQSIQQNWRVWGIKGLLTTHQHFEIGVATAILTARFSMPFDELLLQGAQKAGPLVFFKQQAGTIANLSLYEEFRKTGWTLNLARKVRMLLAPAIAQTIAVTWYLAYQESGKSISNT